MPHHEPDGPEGQSDSGKIEGPETAAGPHSRDQAETATLGEGLQPPASLRRLGDFELMREIGRGGMGIVYEARQVSLNRRVALKVLPPGLGLTTQAVRRFEREAQAAAKLHHTNIVPIYATGRDQGCHYYAMELVEGQSLSQVLDDLRGERSNSLMEATLSRVASAGSAEKAKEPNEAAGSTSLADTNTGGRQWFHTVAGVLAEVGHALEHAHESGVIHRDVKPANLLLSGDGRLSVGDFGLARVAQEPGMTVSGSFLGTPAYMSPEQIAAGRVKVDHRTDIYSLGAVLYEMLTLRRAFPGDSREQILSAILSKEPRPPRRINPRIPVDLETICLKAIEKDPDRRYATAGEMAGDLEQYRQGGLIAARRASLARRAVKLVRRHPLTAVSSVALLIILALAAFAWHLAGRQSEEAALRAVSDARFFMSQGDYREGLVTIDTVLARSPGLSEARLMRARLLIKLDRPREAVEEARALLENDPNEWKGHLILGLAATHLPELSAEEHLRAVEEAAPDTADAYYLRGLIEEDDRGAIELLDRSLQLDPAGADAMLERCRRHIDLKNFQAALLDGERLIALRPRSAQGRRMMGETYRALHDSERALVELERAIQLDPADPATLVSRASLLEELGREQEALADLGRAIALDPDYARLYEQRSQIYTKLRQFDNAIADAERAIQLNDEFPDAHWALAGAYHEMGDAKKCDAIVEKLASVSVGWQDKGARVRALVRLAWARERRDDVDGALSAWDQAIQLKPDSTEIHGWRAGFLERVGDRDRFEAACDRLESLEPRELDGWTALAEHLRETCERVEPAISACSTLITLAPGWADPYAWRAWMYEAANRYDEALADYARSVELAPRWAEAYGWRAYAYMSMERFEEAIIDFTRFFELGNEDDFFRYLRARALAQTGHEDEAFEDLDFNIRRLPDAGRVYQRRAELHWYLGRPEEALADLQRSVEVDPGYMPGHRMRAFYGLRHSRSCDDAVRDLQKVDELERGSGGVDHWSWTAQMHVFLLARLCPDLYDHDRALELAGRLADLDPLNADYQNIYGEALYRGGRFNEARDALRRCIDLQYKPHPACLAFLAMTHWKLGNRDEARAFYERAQSRFNAWGPDHPAVADIRREAAEVLGLPP